MPIAQRRHPLFLALMKPQPPIYPDAVTAVAWDDDMPVEGVDGVVYLVSRPCAQMRTWARKLQALHRLDDTHKVEEGISSLSLAPLRPGELKTIGIAERDLYSKTGREVRTARAGYRLYWTLPLMLVILERAGGQPVGFVSFQLKWAVCADPAEDREVDLEVEPGQAWIAPAFRGRRWGELAAIAMAMVTRRNVDQVQCSVRWPAGYSAELKVTVGADVYSSSGEAFLRHCAQYISIEVDLLEGCRLEVNEVVFDPRW
ncbi:hypothetical protein ACSFA2_03595 [Variovorax sp. LT2P21]|uniref:hypothetical protein n=1 Tax=Variovorax sp. LT2P21 TaxID=3443731 RepID=UPI003F47A6C2